MSKVRFTTTDVVAMVRDVRASVIGQRLANIYDLNDKTYLFKFATAGMSEKVMLLVESGIRFHTTKYAREKNNNNGLPSPFAMKLRRYLRTKRVEDVRQVGVDRVVDFKFGSGEDSYHIILELYVKGNIVLTDYNYTVIALLRSHVFGTATSAGGDDGADVVLKVGESYPMSELVFSHNPASTAANQSSVAVENVAPTPEDSSTSNSITIDLNDVNCSYEQFVRWSHMKIMEVSGPDAGTSATSASNTASAVADVTGDDGVAESQPQQQASATIPTRKAKQKKLTLRQLLLSKESGVSQLGTEIVDHCLVNSGLSPTLKLDPPSSSTHFVVTAQQFQNLLFAIHDSYSTLLVHLNRPGAPGFILCKSVPMPPSRQGNAMSGSNSNSASEQTQQEFEEFVPFIFAQHKDRSYITFPSFDQAVDEYFCKVSHFS
jgi:hypothetical protein